MKGTLCVCLLASVLQLTAAFPILNRWTPGFNFGAMSAPSYNNRQLLQPHPISLHRRSEHLQSPPVQQQFTNQNQFHNMKVDSFQVVSRPLRFSGEAIPIKVDLPGRPAWVPDWVPRLMPDRIDTGLTVPAYDFSLGNWTKRIPAFKHSGVEVTLKDGSKYLFHNPGGDIKKTVATSVDHMSKIWQPDGPHGKFVGDKKVGDIIRAGGSSYNFYNNNCHDATARMCNLELSGQKHVGSNPIQSFLQQAFPNFRTSD